MGKKFSIICKIVAGVYLIAVSFLTERPAYDIAILTLTIAALPLPIDTSKIAVNIAKIKGNQ